MNKQTHNTNPVNLNEEDRKIYDALQQLDEDTLLNHLKDIREERTLEFQIYSSREQWFWVIWTAYLAGALLAISTNIPLICIMVTIITGIMAIQTIKQAMPGLEASYDALSMRHKWVVAITEINKAYPRIQTLSFKSRLLKIKKGDQPEEIIDEIHKKGFEFPLKAERRTAFIWTIFAFISLVHLIYLIFEIAGLISAGSSGFVLIEKIVKLLLTPI